MAKYLRTPCFSRPRTNASDRVHSASFGSPFARAASMLPALTIARARSRDSAEGSVLLGSSISRSVGLGGFGGLFQNWRPARNVRCNRLAQEFRAAFRFWRHRAAELAELFRGRRIV